jgi:hypothetical protein
MEWDKPCRVTHHVVGLQWAFSMLVVGIKTSELCQESSTPKKEETFRTQKSRVSKGLTCPSA